MFPSLSLGSIIAYVVVFVVGFMVRDVWARKFPSRVIMVDSAAATGQKAVVTTFDAVKTKLGINSISDIPKA